MRKIYVTSTEWAAAGTHFTLDMRATQQEERAEPKIDYAGVSVPEAQCLTAYLPSEATLLLC